jgi:hypothetical protein
MGLPVALRAGEPKLALVAAGLTGGICCFLGAVCCVSLCLMPPTDQTRMHLPCCVRACRAYWWAGSSARKSMMIAVT